MGESDDGSVTSAIWRLGNEGDAVSGLTKPGMVLMGGGTDVATAFEWQIRNAAGGDFVILRTFGTDAYNPWVYNLSIALDAQLNSVTTLLMSPADSTNSTFLKYISDAEAIFIAGGDQSTYIKQWTGTEVQAILNSKLSTVTMGGTSAGLAILGGYIFSAESDETITSATALAHPNNANITLVPAFLDVTLLSTVLTDTHFVTRNRMGRMLTFLARLLVPTNSSLKPVVLGSVHGVGVDERTAILLNVTTGVGTVVGSSTAYVCGPTVEPEKCSSGLLCAPLTFRDIACQRFYGGNNETIDFHAFKALEQSSVTYTNTIVSGVFSNHWPLNYGPLPNPSFPLNSTGGSVTVPMAGSGSSITAIVAAIIATVLIGAAVARYMHVSRRQSKLPLSSFADRNSSSSSSSSSSSNLHQPLNRGDADSIHAAVATTTPTYRL